MLCEVADYIYVADIGASERQARTKARFALEIIHIIHNRLGRIENSEARAKAGERRTHPKGSEKSTHHNIKPCMDVYDCGARANALE